MSILLHIHSWIKKWAKSQAIVVGVPRILEIGSENGEVINMAMNNHAP